MGLLDLFYIRCEVITKKYQDTLNPTFKAMNKYYIFIITVTYPTCLPKSFFQRPIDGNLIGFQI